MSTLLEIISSEDIFDSIEMFDRKRLGIVYVGDVVIFLGGKAVAEFYSGGPPGGSFETHIVKSEMIHVMTKYGIGWVCKSSTKAVTL